MTSTCAVISMAKALWLRATGQSGWCRCIVCRDKILNSPDPLHFSEDARKFQKRLRQKAKAHKIKICFVTKKDPHGEDNDGMYEQPTSRTENSNVGDTEPNSLPPTSGIPETPRERDIDVDRNTNGANKGEKSVRFADPLHQEYSKDRHVNTVLLFTFIDVQSRANFPSGQSQNLETQRSDYRSDTSISSSSSSKEEDKLETCFSSNVDEYIDYYEDRVIPKYGEQRKQGTIPILSSLRTILENTSPTSLDSAELDIVPCEKIWKDDKPNLYEAPPPRKLPQRATFFYHDDDSMNSYGTITSQELLEVFQKAAEESIATSLPCLDDNQPACVDENFFYADLV